MTEPAEVIPLPAESDQLKQARARAVRIWAEYRHTLLLELAAADDVLAGLRGEPRRRGRRSHQGGVYKHLEDWARENPGAVTNTTRAYEWVVAHGWDTTNVLEPRRAVGSALAHLHTWGRAVRRERGARGWYRAFSADEQAAAADSERAG